MGKPVIGITTSRTNKTASSVEFGIPEAYIRAIRQAGGVPLMIPLGLDEDDLRTVLQRLDAVLFTGGGDIHPQKYHGSAEELVHYVDQDRDDVELSLVQEATRRRMPLLGICRGLQLINVAMGGTLYEDISEQYSGDIRHNSAAENGRGFRAHPVAIQPASALNKLLGTTSTEVNSLHHQAIRRLGAGLAATAEAPDGVIEGIEIIDYPFGIAVQWHPEDMLDDGSMRRLFEAFVEAAMPDQPSTNE